MTSSNYHHGDLKQALIKEANHVLSQGEIEKLSLRQLAKACNVSATAVYRHFDNKQSLLTQLAANGFDAFTEYMKNDLQPDDSPVTQLQKIGTAYVNFALKNPHLFRLLFSSLLTSQHQSESLEKSGRKNHDLLTRIITNGIKQNVFSGDPETLSLAAWSMVHGLATLLVDNALEAGQETHTDSIIKAVTGFLYSGILVKA